MATRSPASHRVPAIKSVTSPPPILPPSTSSTKERRTKKHHVQRANLPPRHLPHRLPPRHLQLRPLALLFLTPTTPLAPSSSSIFSFARLKKVPQSLPMPHRQQGAPKGCVTVRVGAEGEEQRRFAVPLVHLKHPLFVALLEEAEREYGFRQQGAIAIPCRVDRFVQVETLIDRDLGDQHHNHLVDLDNCGAVVTGGHNHSHSHGHIHLPRFVGCFRD